MDSGAPGCRRTFHGLLAALVGLLLVLAAVVIGAAPAAAQNGVGASTFGSANTIGVSTDIGAAQRLRKTVPQPAIVVATGVAANTGADFVASADGVVVSTSRSRLVQGFEDAGLVARPTGSAGTEYPSRDGSLVRVMEPSGQAPLRASFTNSNGGPISPFTGKPVQPPPGLTAAERFGVRPRQDARGARTMIEELISALLPHLPLKIDWVEFTDPVLTLGGDGWSLSLACPWRLVGGTSVVSAWDDVDGGFVLGPSRARDHQRWTPNRGDREDPAFSLTGELRLEVLADSDVDPWALRLPSQTLVGRSQRGGSGT